MCTVKPSSDYRYCDTHNASGHTEYAEIDMDSLRIKNEDDSDDASNNGSPTSNDKSEKQRSNSKTEVKRHSMPPALPESPQESPTTEWNRDNTLHYLELNFPGADRPRNQSEVSRSPKVPPRSTKPRKKPGAYIELEFNRKEDALDAISNKDRSASGSGDTKSSSLP